VTGTIEVRLADDQLDILVERIAERLRDPEPDRWLNTAEAAAYTGHHVDTIRSYAREGRIPVAQECDGGRMRFKQSDLDAHMRGRR
jgi:excisionase family DNA binding protein